MIRLLRAFYVAKQGTVRHAEDKRLFALAACVAFAASVNASDSIGSSKSGCVERLEDFHREATRLELKLLTWKPDTGTRILDAYDAHGLYQSMDGCLESPDGLNSLFRATRTAAFYNPDHDGIADRLYAVFGILRNSGEATARHLFQTHLALVANRQFERANLVAERSDRLFTFDVRDEIGDGDDRHAMSRTVLAPLTDSSVLERREVVLPEGRIIVLIFDTSCGVSVSLLSRIFQDEGLLNAMKDRTILLIPQSSPLDPPAVRTWQENQPFDIYWMYREREWPEIASRLTPTIYFFEDGEKVASIEGAREGVRQRLIEFLE